jgi:hypothetical protein
MWAYLINRKFHLIHPVGRGPVLWYAALSCGFFLCLMCRSQTGIPSTCKLRRQNVVRIPDDDKVWLVTPSSATVDYIFTSPTRSRKKAGPAIWHAPMILPLASDRSSNSDANIEPNLPPSDSNDDITAMLLDMLESSPGPHRWAAVLAAISLY